MDTSIDIDQKNVVDLKSKSKIKPNFNWEDPLLLDSLISEEEALIKSTAHEIRSSQTFTKSRGSIFRRKN